MRFFDKDEKGAVTELPNDDAFSDALNGKGELEKEFKLDLASDMRQLLGALKQDGSLKKLGIDDPDAVAKDLEAQLGNLDDPEGLGERFDEYIKELEDKLEAQGLRMDRLTNMDDDDFENDFEFLDQPIAKPKTRRPVPQIPTEMWTYNQRRRLSRLNAILERVDKQLRLREAITAKTVQSVWKAYNLARQTLAKGWANVPQEVWDLLWAILSVEEAVNPSRFAFLSLLARDMSEAKVALNPSQQLITMEALFVDGFEAKAIDNWKRCMSTLGDSGSDTFQEFWELGVRMSCQAEDLVQAERAINKLLERQLDPRILMPYIRTCAAQPTDEMQEKAWNAYRRMRDLLGESMGLEDYDQVIAFFLTTNQTERALFAFVDMMTSGTVDLRGVTQLPSSIGNKFFFGKWLKRLIGAGDLDGAHSVFQFMCSRGIQPASIQINGLIGAWQRSGGADDLQKADKLAWDMVRARIRFVDARRRLAGLEGGAYTQDAKTSSIYEADPMPKATLETFSLLAENYRVRRLQKPMEDLWVAFREAEISPDAFMLNQLMESHSQFGDIDEAQELYRSLVHERGVKPDSYTFMALWKMIGVNRLQILSEDRAAGEIRLTRETFAETVRFAHVFKGQSLDGQLARKMLHTFRRLKDNLGLVVAMRALRAVFGYVPPEVLGLEMVIGTTNLAWDTATARQKLRLAKRKIDKWVEDRQKQLGRPVRTLDDMTPEERGLEMMEYLESEYLPAARNVEDDVADVAREMGVYDIVKDH
ncbi:hypothetical protein D7B24_005982 [Verticillium nonalfalfae]|uniref:Pentatricopeptide repeat domain-containing protein n=1 Tax=Verticillium nonalfalfae TaxID=1051616 RepID=A0A3M9YLA6_9PEZI|nr:uncharacterized protein D7B24_005982 [Verticillium nonalfalfae]RNJ60831.1 hypothetical protein D7B24_005982 [Verticillium nonalfalfae]